MRDQLVSGERHAELRNYTRHHQLSPLGIGYSEDRSFADGWMCVKDRFDLAGVDVLSARHNHVFQAIKNITIPR